MPLAKLNTTRPLPWHKKRSRNSAPNMPQSKSNIGWNWQMLVLLLAVLWLKIRRPLLGGLALFLALWLIMSMAGCSPKVVRVPCGPDPGSIIEIDLPPARPELANGDLADDYRLLRDRVAADSKAKTDLREELRACLR